MANYDDVIRRWVDRQLGRTERQNYRNDRLIAEDDALYSYGRHFPLLRVLRDGKGKAVGTILNGDRYSVTTTRHQGYARDAAARLGLPTVTIPFEALGAARISPQDVRIIDTKPDWATTTTTTRHELPPRTMFATCDVTEYGELPMHLLERRCHERWERDLRAWEESQKIARENPANDYWARRAAEPRPELPTVDSLAPYDRRGSYRVGAEIRLVGRNGDYYGANGWSVEHETFGAEPVGTGLDGVKVGIGAALIGALTGRPVLTFTRTTHRHWLGGSVVKAKVQWRTRTDDGWRTHVRHAYFISGFDNNEPRPLYFFSELPRGSKPTTYDEALECLKPEAVKLAEQVGRKVERQGDVFAIEIPTVTRKDLRKAGATFAKTAHVLGTNHAATEVAILPDGTTLGRGTLWHKPGPRRRPDHVRRPMGDRKTWHALVKNTVPVARRVTV